MRTTSFGNQYPPQLVKPQAPNQPQLQSTQAAASTQQAAPSVDVQFGGLKDGFKRIFRVGGAKANRTISNIEDKHRTELNQSDYGKLKEQAGNAKDQLAKLQGKAKVAHGEYETASEELDTVTSEARATLKARKEIANQIEALKSDGAEVPKALENKFKLISRKAEEAADKLERKERKMDSKKQAYDRLNAMAQEQLANLKRYSKDLKALGDEIKEAEAMQEHAELMKGLEGLVVDDLEIDTGLAGKIRERIKATREDYETQNAKINGVTNYKTAEEIEMEAELEAELELEAQTTRLDSLEDLLLDDEVEEEQALEIGGKSSSAPTSSVDTSTGNDLLDS